MVDYRIPFNKPFIAGREVDYMVRAVREGQLAGNGPYSRRCQEWLEQRLGAKKALLTPSCTAALEMAAILCDIGPGDEVIMPSFTFTTTATAFVLRGGVPVFVDIRPDTLNLSETRVADAVTEKTRAIVAVHYGGVGCEMDRILEIAAEHELFVVEDAAQALLSTYRGEYLGTIGHFGCLSFHETKNIIAGEGGALLINDARFVDRADIIREKGTNRSAFTRGEVDRYTWVEIGSSYLPSELVGAFLFGQLEQADGINRIRVAIVKQYQEALRPLQDRGFLTLPSTPAHCAHNGHVFYVLTGSRRDRDGLIGHLGKHGILAVFHYVPLHSSPAGRKYGRVHGSMEHTDGVSDRLVRLPLYFGMKESEVAFVCEKTKEFFGMMSVSRVPGLRPVQPVEN